MHSELPDSLMDLVMYSAKLSMILTPTVTKQPGIKQNIIHMCVCERACTYVNAYVCVHMCMLYVHMCVCVVCAHMCVFM